MSGGGLWGVVEGCGGLWIVLEGGGGLWRVVEGWGRWCRMVEGRNSRVEKTGSVPRESNQPITDCSCLVADLRLRLLMISGIKDDRINGSKEKMEFVKVKNL